MGDPLGSVDGLVPDDVYQLSRDAQAIQIHAVGDQIRVSQCRTPLSPEALLTFMTPTGQSHQAILLTGAKRVILLPLDHMQASVPYRLIACDVAAAKNGFERVRSAAFGRGTSVTMGNGTKRPIEDIVPGDVVQTVGMGTRTVAGVAGHTQLLCDRSSAVRVSAGTFGAIDDLVMRPQQRIFVPSGPVDMAALVHDCVNETDVTTMMSGTVAFVQLLFETPCVFYANGLAVESRIADQTQGTSIAAGTSHKLAKMLQIPASSEPMAANSQSAMVQTANTKTRMSS
jgi:hypothetical protein